VPSRENATALTSLVTQIGAQWSLGPPVHLASAEVAGFLAGRCRRAPRRRHEPSGLKLNGLVPLRQRRREHARFVAAEVDQRP
jgi:hypothetical protein